MIYVYKVEWYYDYKNKMIKSAGVISADSMSEAVAKLDGEIFDNIESVQLFTFEGSDSNCAPFKEIEALFNRENLVDED